MNLPQHIIQALESMMRSTKRSQILSSGLVVYQDFAEAVRAAFFQIDMDEFIYATQGGTLFVVSFRGRIYGLTCRHVIGSFDPGTLFITPRKRGIKGDLPAPVTGVFGAAAAEGAATGTDVDDLCAIQFSDDIKSGFFSGTEYILDEKTVGTSKEGDSLIVVGVLKEKSSIIPPNITMGFCRLMFTDAGPTNFDPLLRQAKTKFVSHDFETLTGISGAPVFNVTRNVVCGMVVRAGMNGPGATAYYLDIFDIMKFLEGIAAGASCTSYTKTLMLRQST